MAEEKDRKAEEAPAEDPKLAKAKAKIDDLKKEVADLKAEIEERGAAQADTHEAIKEELEKTKAEREHFLEVSTNSTQVLDALKEENRKLKEAAKGGAVRNGHALISRSEGDDKVISTYAYAIPASGCIVTTTIARTGGRGTDEIDISTVFVPGVAVKELEDGTCCLERKIL